MNNERSSNELNFQSISSPGNCCLIVGILLLLPLPNSIKGPSVRAKY